MGLTDRIASIFNVDTWANVLSGIGVKGRDRRLETDLEVDIVTEERARNLWRSDFLARSCITKLPEEAFREGFVIKAKGVAKDKIEAVHTRLEELGVSREFIQAAKFERAYGGGALFPVVNDQNADLAQPLSIDRIASVSAIHALEPRELLPVSYYESILDSKWRKPRTWRLAPSGMVDASLVGQVVHESRLIILPGVRVTNENAFAERAGWGDNALTVANQTLADFGLSIGSIASMIDQFSQGVLKLDGLGEMLAQDQGKKVRDRLLLMDQTKSILRTLVVDKNDDFKREHVSFTGLPEVIRMLMYIVAAALDVPVTLLFGMEPAGMNATGAFDIRSYYDRVHNKRTTDYKDPLERLIKIVMLSKDGPTGGKEPAQWSVEWRPLWQMTDKEREETRKIRTENDVALIDAQIASPDEIRHARYGGDTYSYELTLTGDAPVPEMDPAQVAALEAANARTGDKRSLRAIAQAALDEPDEPPDDLEAPSEADINAA